jgi:hypothetical protein
MKKLKHIRTVFYDGDLDKWISFYVDDKNQTIIDKKEKNQKDIFTKNTKKLNIKKLNTVNVKDKEIFKTLDLKLKKPFYKYSEKTQIKMYEETKEYLINKKKSELIKETSYLVEPKNSHKFDYLDDYVADKNKLEKILLKKKITPEILLKIEKLSDKEQKKILKDYINDKDEKFLKAMLKNPYFEHDVNRINLKLSGEKQKQISEHLIKKVTLAKYTSTILYIIPSEHDLLRKLFKDFDQIQIRFFIGSEVFFTPIFKPSETTNYEKIFLKTLSKYPLKVNFQHLDLRIQIL